jgi:hypothetical protein
MAILTNSLRDTPHFGFVFEVVSREQATSVNQALIVEKAVLLAEVAPISGDVPPHKLQGRLPISLERFRCTRRCQHNSSGKPGFPVAVAHGFVSVWLVDDLHN